MCLFFWKYNEAETAEKEHMWQNGGMLNKGSVDFLIL